MREFCVSMCVSMFLFVCLLMFAQTSIYLGVCKPDDGITYNNMIPQAQSIMFQR